MDVMKPTSPNLAYNFNSVPSSPTRFAECFFSAPTSPSRMYQFYREFDRLSTMDDTQIPENCSGTPKALQTTKIDDEEDEFDFDFRLPSEKTHQLSAEELFAGGKIKPLKPPPRLQIVDENDPKTPFLPSPKSSKSPFSPRRKKDPSETAIERARESTENGRGRQRVQDSPLKNSSRRTTRSLSPYRVPWEEEQQQQQQREKQHQNDEISKLFFSSSSSKGSSSSRKWKLKDLLLFRSASEGHNKDPLMKYSSGFFRKPECNSNKNSSFKSKDISTADRSKRKVSAHELHYTTNKATSDNLKKKTFLPYKHGILGKLAFNSNGFGRSYNYAK